MVYLLIAALLIGFTAPAHAYVDAGSGSYMLQMGIAGILGIVFSIKLSWQRLKAFVGGLFNHQGRTDSRRGA